MLTRQLTFSPLELCDRGEYEAAAEMLGLTVGQWPENVSGGQYAQAEATLVAGIITSTIGGIQQTGDQDVAREMLNESIRLFGDDPRSLIAESWLAWTDYWAGDFDSVLVATKKVLQASPDDPTRFRVLYLRSAVYWDQGLPNQAFAELSEMEPLYDERDPLAKGKFHNQRAVILRQKKETDRAIVDLDAASNFFRQVGSVRWQAVATNNLAGVYLETEQFAKAHEHATKARELFHELGDKAYEAEAWDQTARIFLAEAKQAADSGIALVEKGKIKPFRVVQSQSENATMHRADNLPKTQLTERRGVMMAPLENAVHLIQNEPDKAAHLLDLIILLRTVRDDPQLDAEMDAVERMLHSYTEEGEEARARHRKHTLLRMVPTSDS